jgi:mRNA interferase RelE/StbE
VAYTVQLAAAAQRQLRGLPQAVLNRLLPRIADLANEPRPQGCKKLQGEIELYRVRVGEYRVIYAIDDDALTVLVVKIADRKEAYRRRFP